MNYLWGVTRRLFNVLRIAFLVFTLPIAVVVLGMGHIFFGMDFEENLMKYGNWVFDGYWHDKI